MKLTLEECKNRMDEYGNLYLSGCTSLTSLPEGLTVGGSLYSWGMEVIMKLTLEECKNRMDEYGNLYLSGCTSLTSLPEGLTVGGSLYLRGCTGLTGHEEYRPHKLKDGDYVAGLHQPDIPAGGPDRGWLALPAWLHRVDWP